MILNLNVLTWSVAEHPQVRLLLCQDFEHHVSGSLASAVQHPGAGRLQGAQRADVDHSPPYTWTLRESLQDSGSEAQGGADIKRQVGVHLGHVGEALGVAGHVTQGAWGERERRVTVCLQPLTPTSQSTSVAQITIKEG